MIYLFVGQDTEKKDLQVAGIKEKILPAPDALKFDFEILYANKLEPATLKKALVALPAVSSRRLILVKEAHKLSPYNKELIVNFSKSPGQTVLILDLEKIGADDVLIKGLGSTAKVSYFKKEFELSVFDVARAISRGKQLEALKILFQLLQNGEQPLQIMGGLIWSWKNSRQEYSPGQYKKGLLVLQEADLNIKRSRLKPEHALELAVVKLCQKEGG